MSDISETEWESVCYTPQKERFVFLERKSYTHDP